MRSITIISVVFVLTACGSKHDSGTASSSPDLAGTWSTACVMMDSTNYGKLVETINGNTVVQEVTSYGTNSGCVDPRLDVKTTSTFSIGDPVAGLDSTYKWNLTAVKVEAAFYGTSAAAANQAQLYGITNWADSTFQDVTGKQETSTTTDVVKAGDVEYSIFKLSGTSLTAADKSSADGKTDATRFTKLNTSLVLTKE